MADDDCRYHPVASPRAAAARIWNEPDAVHIDVRGLAPPQPLIEILRLVATLPADGRLLVHHDRDPMLLYPELDAIGWQADRVDAGEPGEVRLRITRRGA